MRRRHIIWLLILIAIPAFFKLWWLVGFFAIISISFLLFLSVDIKKCKRVKWLVTPTSVLFILVLAISIKFLFIELYAIPSNSMEEMLFPGDKILVNKLAYGPRCPASPYDIPWINLVWYFIAGKSSIPNSIYWNYKRLRGYADFERQDVMVFSHPVWGGKNNILIKRCVALPGDTLQIINGELLINSCSSNEVPHTKKRYQIFTKNHDSLALFADSINIEIRYNRNKTGATIESLLTQKNMQALSENHFIDSLKAISIPWDSAHMVYPYHSELRWSIDFYGPVVIPHKGKKIALNPDNVRLYYKVITECEGVKLENRNGTYYLENKPAKEFTFRKNYFFMLGDNRHYSSDSRYWGFLPEECIIGRADAILFNFYSGSFMKRRYFRKIKSS